MGSFSRLVVFGSDLPMDLDQIITREDEQLQTVGSHWPKSGPLTREVRDNMERVGVCLSCHQELPQGRLIKRPYTMWMRPFSLPSCGCRNG
ncbi:MAG: hypothetical protein PVI13_08305 [Desulfobacterales bacterium]|jgi:hypothetical protein